MDSIGTQLKQAREARGVTLSEAASATRVKLQHLESMEADDFSNMAAAAYARGFIKIYAEYLDVPVEPLIRAYSEIHAPAPRRQGLSSDDLPAKPLPAEAEADSVREKTGASWSELIADVGLVKRIMIPVAGIVIIVLVGTGLFKIFTRGGADDQPPPVVTETGLPPLLVADPPDPYPDAPTPGETLP